MTASRSLIVFSPSPDRWPDGSDPVGTLACLAAGGAELLGDLPRLAECRDGRLGEIARQPNITFVSPYADAAVRALLDYAGCALDDSARTVDLFDEAAMNLLFDALPAPTADHRRQAGELLDREAHVECDWPAWFPVIRFDRCTRCGQCVTFCAFGVYRAEADRTPRVAHPRNCKNLCPACSRVCPVGAILFPRCDEPTINGRSEPNPDHAPPDFAQLIERARKAAENDPC